MDAYHQERALTDWYTCIEVLKANTTRKTMPCVNDAELGQWELMRRARHDADGEMQLRY